jgi:6-pyruvoyltetrahydropterin/6-carboxytetrahydropterin synthase
MVSSSPLSKRARSTNISPTKILLRLRRKNARGGRWSFTRGGTTLLLGHFETGTKIMVSCTRRIQFCAGHRVWRHESKCAHLHGHNYVAFFHATAPSLDDLGRVIDFTELKSRLGRWIDENWDHGFIVFAQDEAAMAAVLSIPGQKVFRLDSNPTAENLAAYLLRVVAPAALEGTGVEVDRVELWETENCRAEARRVEQVPRSRTDGPRSAEVDHV